MRSPRGTASGSRSIALALLPFPIPGSSSRPCRPPGTPRGPARGQAPYGRCRGPTGPGGAPTRRSARERPDRRPSPARHRSDRANRRRGCDANVVLPKMLGDTTMEARDKGFATELVYGSTRMKRRLDHLVDRFLLEPPPSSARAALRIGAHQLLHLDTPPHAAVSATVAAAPKRFRGWSTPCSARCQRR